MRIVELHIQGYRSLYDVHFVPGTMSVLVGPNNAGKTNFVEAIDFLAETHRHGLEVAINRKGGIENITHRKMRRTRLDLMFDLTVSLSPREIPRYFGPSDDDESKMEQAVREVLVRHRFSFHPLGQAIESDYRVVNEHFAVSVMRPNGRKQLLLEMDRSADDIEVKVADKISDVIRPLIDPFTFSDFREYVLARMPSPGRLLLETMPYNPAIQAATDAVARTRMYQLVPLEGRTPGVPTPNAEIEHHGRNLPAMVAYLQRHDPKAWSRIMHLMRRIIPGLTDVKTDFTPDRRLALQFVEQGVRRAWSSEDVSDGTIQSLALFTALLDRRTPTILIEEPENSVHPWIIRNFVEACREANKQIVITTHSPVLISYLEPTSIYVVSRHAGRTDIKALTDLDPDIQRLWESGTLSLFDIIDSGAIPEAVPEGPQ